MRPLRRIHEAPLMRTLAELAAEMEMVSAATRHHTADVEATHYRMDGLLLASLRCLAITDEEKALVERIAKAFDDSDRWYA